MPAHPTEPSLVCLCDLRDAEKEHHNSPDEEAVNDFNISMQVLQMIFFPLSHHPVIDVSFQPT